MISSKNEHVFIRDLSNLTLQITFDAWRASMNLGSKRPIAWNDSGHAPSRWFWLHCRIGETGSAGIIFCMWHHGLRHPSEHGTSFIGKHLLATARMAKLNTFTEAEVTELTSSTVDETAWGKMKRPGSRGIPIVSAQRIFIFHIKVWFILTELIDKTLQTGSEGLWYCRISLRHLESLPHVTFCFSTYAMECSSKPRATNDMICITKRLGAPSGSTLSNICQRDYTLTVDAT